MMSEIMKAFRVKGKFIMGKSIMSKNWQRFTKEVASLNKEEAKERVYSDLGSKHRVKRRNIKVEEIGEIAEDEITNSRVKYSVSSSVK
jgi:large subunit ribosomal protein LX